MRKAVPYMMGLVGFAAIATGGERGVILDSPPLNQKPYVWYAKHLDGTAVDPEKKFREFKVERRFEYRMKGAKIDSKNKGRLAADPDAIITLYTKGERKPEKVDCRMVARDMVETLIGYRIDTFERSSRVDGQSRIYSIRDDRNMSALMARNLKTITIQKGDRASYRCKATKVDGERALCGHLTVTYKRRENPAVGADGNKYAYLFNPAACEANSNDMSFEACKLLMKVEACGLRYVQKGLYPKPAFCADEYAKSQAFKKPKTKRQKQIAAARSYICSAPKLGLTDLLEEIAGQELVDRESGEYYGIDSPEHGALYYTGEPEDEAIGSLPR